VAARHLRRFHPGAWHGAPPAASLGEAQRTGASSSGQSSGRSDWPRGRWGQGHVLRRRVSGNRSGTCKQPMPRRHRSQNTGDRSSELKRHGQTKDTKIVPFFRPPPPSWPCSIGGAPAVRARTACSRGAGASDHQILAHAGAIPRPHHHASVVFCRCAGRGHHAVTDEATGGAALQRPAHARVRVLILFREWPAAGALLFTLRSPPLPAQLAFSHTAGRDSPWSKIHKLEQRCSAARC